MPILTAAVVGGSVPGAGSKPDFLRSSSATERVPRVAPGTLARGENADGSGRAVEGQLLIGTIHHRKRNPFNFRNKK